MPDWSTSAKNCTENLMNNAHEPELTGSWALLYRLTSPA
ncbi:Unknown protein sequence [Pseudomonas coronafaciens pv. oryzae]|nr:Unknown protein sequence [Pseudomonas coronafaciens pv. oryzae]